MALNFLRRRALRDYAAMPSLGADPGWWPEFEREFLDDTRARIPQAP